MKIDVVDWKLIGACNLRCLHCYGPPKTERALPLAKLLAIAETFGELGVEWVVLTGGEPLLVPGIEEVMEKLTSLGIKIALSTNTTYFRKYQEIIEKYVSSLNIPLDGSTADIHALSRRNESSYYTFFDILQYYQENLHKKPQLLRIGSVYSKATQGDFISMARQLESFADIIDTWKIYEMIDYEFQPELRKPIISEKESFQEEMNNLLGNTPLAPKIMVTPANNRDKAFFMINPKGYVVIPTDIDGRTIEIPTGNLLINLPQEIIERWQKKIIPQNYYQNHGHYAKPIQIQPMRIKLS